MDPTRIVLLTLGILCLLAGIRTYRKGHPWTILSLIIFNCGMTCLTLALGRPILGEHSAFYFSILLFPIGLFVFFRNIQTSILSRMDRLLIGLSMIDLSIGIGLTISSYFLPAEAYLRPWVLYVLAFEYHETLESIPSGRAFRAMVTAILHLAFYVQMLLTPLALVSSYVFVSRARRRHLDFFSEDTFGFYLWSQRTVILTFACFIFIGGIILYNLRVTFSRNSLQLAYILIGVAGTAFGLLAYWGPSRLRQEKEFDEFLADSDIVVEDKSVVDSSKREEQMTRLKKVMKDDLAYQDPELTLSKLAAMLDMSSRHLSRVINESLGQNFSDFVNQHRVEEVKRNLIDPAFQNYSVQGIGLEAGFSSKSSFYTVFKKHTGMTPARYRSNA